jgi:hypothetical protein
MYRQTLIATLGASWLAMVRRCALMVQTGLSGGHAEVGQGALCSRPVDLTAARTAQLLPKEDNKAYQ